MPTFHATPVSKEEHEIEQTHKDDLRFRINPEDSGDDSEANPDDDARSTVSRASTTFSVADNKLRDENLALKQQTITAQNDISRLQEQLAALQLVAEQAAAREHEAEARGRREAEEKLLADRAADAQRIESAVRQAEADKLALENAENQAREQATQLAAVNARLAEFERVEAEKKAAEEAARQAVIEAKRQAEEAEKKAVEEVARQTEMLKQQQLESQRQQTARIAEKKAWLYAKIGDPASCYMLENHHIKSEADLDRFIYDFIHFPLGRPEPRDPSWYSGDGRP